MKVTFQHLDSQSHGSDSIVLFGRTKGDQSVAIWIKGFQPSLCIQTENPDEMIGRIKYALSNYRSTKSAVWHRPANSAVYSGKYKLREPQVLFFEKLQGQNICDYNEERTPMFLKIRATNKWVFNDLKAVLTRKCEHVSSSGQLNETIGENTRNDYMLGVPLTLFNEQVNFSLQYLIEKDIYSCSWMEIYGYEVQEKKTTCDIELEGDMNTHIQVKCDEMAPWHILSYDIESVPHPRGNGKYDFPSAQRDPVCTIGAILQKEETINKYVWILSPNGDPLDNLSPVQNPTDEYTSEDIMVFHFSDELRMLESFNNFIVSEDIDILEGYNTSMFDHPYMFDRYKTLCNQLPTWGRLLNTPSKITEKVFQSNQAGKNITKTLYMPGRIDHDAYQVMKKNHNLNSYKLDEVAKEFLGTCKYPMDYNEIHPKFQTKEGRDELAVYCVKDAWLTRKIMHKLSKLFVSFQLSCVTGISLNDVLNRGQGIRTIALMLRYCKKRSPQYFIPRRETKSKINRRKQLCKDDHNYLDTEVIEEEESEGFQGAVVLDPKPKFYKDAIATLDFASLYPSVMMCMNMSYETIISRKKMLKMDWQEDKDVRTVPNYSFEGGRMKTKIDYNTNVIFATKETRRGLLPEILDAVLTERRLVKKEMKKHHPDSVQYKIANGRQLGLKVCANSIYGFTGATVGFLPDKRIAESVTKYGRGLTLKTQDLIENHPVWGLEHGVKCVYGDTDSVFCHLPRSLCNGKTPEETVEIAERIGKEMGEYVDAHFLKPIELEFEKIYLPFLLLKKKRYCGKKYEEGHVKIDMKGVECVRRDFCPLLVNTQKEMLTILMNTMDVDKSCQVVSRAIQDLAMNRVPLDLLTMSKKLSRSPDEYVAMAAHVNLAKRINKERGEQHGFVAGDRVPYVISRGKSHKVSENAVLPEEIESGKYVIDIDYYRDKQLIPPMTRIIEKLIDNPSSLFAYTSIAKPNITGMFGKWVKKRKIVEEKPIEFRRCVKKKNQITLHNFF